jgi:hypothetical protein
VMANGKSKEQRHGGMETSIAPEDD